MKNKNIFSFIVITTIFFVNTIFTKSIDLLKNVDNRNDQEYLIFIKNTFGEINIFSKPKNYKRQEKNSYEFVSSFINEIDKLIINNKDTYKNPEILEEIENNIKLEKRNKDEQPLTVFDNSDFVHVVSSVGNRLVLSAYLSNYVAEEIRYMDNVLEVVPDLEMKLESYYNSNDILKETQWSSLDIKKNADLHLSVISQGLFNTSLVSQYDKNYYYPSSAGKGIDIYIIDTSFNFGYSEFENENDRTAKCIGHVNNKVMYESSSSSCGNLLKRHGQAVSDAAGGLVHGSAKKANIYGISIQENKNGNLSTGDIFTALEYIIEKMTPHKTIINLSVSSFVSKASETYNTYQDLIDKITDNGGIVVAAAGNEGSNVRNLNNYRIPCTIGNSICVGGFYSKEIDDIKNGFSKTENSNFGDEIDIYAPYNVHLQLLKNDTVKNFIYSGTSFSCPLTAGVIATIMSDHSNVNFTKKSILNHLLENALKYKLYDDNERFILNNGKHIVYSTDNIYYGCGFNAGNLPCPSTNANNE